MRTVSNLKTLINTKKIMRLNTKTLTFFSLLFTGFLGSAQICDCTISEVENNTVVPCTTIIGTVDTVYTTNELKTAITQANNIGGNMTILIADGTYQIASPSWYPYITASNMVFRSLSGNRDAVILTGSGMAEIAGVENVFYIVGDNVTIANLTVQEVGNHGIAGQGDELFIFNVKIQDTYEQMIKGTSAGDGADNGRVQCSLFQYTNNVGPNFYIGGLDIHKGNNWVVSDNIFKNIASPSGSVAEHAVHFWNNSADNTIERNIIINCDRGIGFGLGSSPSDGGIIRNNMIYNDGTRPFNDVGIALETSPNTEVYNNTIYIEYQNAIEYRFVETINVEISNNLTNKLIKARNGATANVTSNYTTAPIAWFENPTTGDLRLNANIALVVDAGITIGNVTMDIDQTLRPLSASYDIGAHEYLGSAGINDVENSTSKIIAFPNPATSSFTLKSTVSSIANVTIYNVLNQKIASFEDQQLSSELVINTSEWQAGVYFCQISSSDLEPQLIRILISK